MRAGTLDLAFPLTTRDTPELRARVHRDLDTVWRRVREADARAESLVLTGGFSRGEGSAVGARPLNDYDLVVVRRAPWGSPDYGALAQDLERDLGIAVDLATVTRARLPHLPPTVFWFDVRHGGRVLAGDPRTLDRMPAGSPARVPPGEAARLLANRAAGLLVAAREGADARLARLQAAKALLACGEAALVLRGAYAPTLRERLDRLQRAAKEDEAVARTLPDVEWATAWKLDPAGVADAADAGERWAAARDALLACARRTLPRAGWGDLARYPRRAPVRLVEAAFAAVAARRLPPLRASHEARALGFALLDDARWPAGGSRVPAAAARVARAFGEPAPATWREAVDLLFRLRDRTIQ